MSSTLLQSQLLELECLERRLDEDLRGLALEHYRALSGSASLSNKEVSGPSVTVLERVKAAADALSNGPVDELAGLQRRVAHLRAASASSSVGGVGGVGSGVGSGGGSASTIGGGGGTHAGVAALDLLELPSLMDACVRSALAPPSNTTSTLSSSGIGGSGSPLSGSHVSSTTSTLAAGDDAVDLVDFACTLFASQRLLTIAAGGQKINAKAVDGTREKDTSSQLNHHQHHDHHYRSARALVGVVRDVLGHSYELRAGLCLILSSRSPLPTALKAIALLRRLARVQRRGRERARIAAGAPPDASVPLAGSDAEAADIAAELRALFVAERDWLIAREVEAVATATAAASVSGSDSTASTQGLPSAAQPSFLRVFELHRILTTELVSHFSAVASSLAARPPPTSSSTPNMVVVGGSASTSSAATIVVDARLRAPLAAAIAWRADATLSAACTALISLPEAGAASAAQPMAYAARRAARFGTEFSAPLGAAWSAFILDTLAARLAAARRAVTGADPKDERACSVLVNAALRATLGVANSLRTVLPAAQKRAIVDEFLQHIDALADARAVTAWASCASAFADAAEPLLSLCERYATE
jgi:hypothetical protein